jgi:hypothetical protein
VAIGRGGGGGFESPSSSESQPAVAVRISAASRAVRSRAGMRETVGDGRQPAAAEQQQ